MNFKNFRDVLLIFILGWKQIAQPEDRSLRDLAHARCIEGQWPITINLYVLIQWLLKNKREVTSSFHEEMLYEAAMMEGASPSEARSLVFASRVGRKPYCFLYQAERFIKLPARKSPRHYLQQPYK